MFKSILSLPGLFIPLFCIAQNIIRLEIKSLPAYHTPYADIYVAGSFNSWNPQDEKYKFQQNTDNSYFINLKLDNGIYEYKITRGGWDRVETKKGGVEMKNRSLKVEGDATVELNIEEWADRFPAKPRTSTASKNVHIIDTAFLIPQLKRVRRIWIYLPENYKTYRYPVLYMHDGQNVFDDATSYAGEWGVDEFLDSARKKCIVVAINHGGPKRINEYCPYDMEKYGKGEGNEYVDFLVKTLKPFIDKSYHTLSDKSHTFIAGSSMGGLISMYAVLKYPKVFGGAGVFSPALWINGPKIFNDIKIKAKNVNSKIYFYGGKQEGETMIPDILKAFEAMHKVSKSKMKTVIRDEGKHNEGRWRIEFPLFYRWINP